MSDVSLFVEENRVEILVTHGGGRVVCPECDARCTIADHAPERSWRHLDTMQFETKIRARTPRADCKVCGVKTITVPWAGKHSRFTLMFEAVAIDMWAAFEKAAGTHAPQADIVHDRFHISKHLNDAVDKVRRQEHKALKKEGDERLTGSKHSWLFNPENMKEQRWLDFQPLKNSELKTSRAWAIKEQFRWFWEYTYAGNARKFFKSWYGWAARCRLAPVIEVAKMLKNRLPNILSYFRHGITNAMSEGFNSRIQSIKASARGFHAFDNYRTRILFHCGKLDLKPETTH